jgi:predicted nucleic acid-binding protein
MELIQGARDARQVREAVALVSPLSVIWPSTADCERGLADFTAFHLSHGLGLLDALIAACAVGCSAELCTFNEKHYRMVPQLVTVQPYSR